MYESCPWNGTNRIRICDAMKGHGKKRKKEKKSKDKRQSTLKKHSLSIATAAVLIANLRYWQACVKTDHTLSWQVSDRTAS